MSVNLDIPLGSALVFCFQENPKNFLDNFEQKTTAIDSNKSVFFFLGGGRQEAFCFSKYESQNKNKEIRTNKPTMNHLGNDVEH